MNFDRSDSCSMRYLAAFLRFFCIIRFFRYRVPLVEEIIETGVEGVHVPHDDCEAFVDVAIEIIYQVHDGLLFIV